jgi:hypothetical protein
MLWIVALGIVAPISACIGYVEYWAYPATAFCRSLPKGITPEEMDARAERAGFDAMAVSSQRHWAFHARDPFMVRFACEVNCKDGHMVDWIIANED